MPEFIDVITDDHSPREFLLPDFVLCLGWYEKSQLICLACYHKFKDGVKLHFHVLPEYRLEHARRLAKESLIENLRPIYVETPTLYPKVINFVLKNGFKTIEIEKQAYLKNGQLHDLNLMVY